MRRLCNICKVWTLNVLRGVFLYSMLDHAFLKFEASEGAKLPDVSFPLVLHCDA